MGTKKDSYMPCGAMATNNKLNVISVWSSQGWKSKRKKKGTAKGRDIMIESHYSIQSFWSNTFSLLLLVPICFKAIMDEHYNFDDARE